MRAEDFEVNVGSDEAITVLTNTILDPDERRLIPHQVVEVTIGALAELDTGLQQVAMIVTVDNGAKTLLIVPASSAQILASSLSSAAEALL